MSPRVLKLLGLSCAVLLAAWLISLYRQVPHSKSPYAKALTNARDIQITQGFHRILLHKEKEHWTVAASTGSAAYAADEDRLHTLTSGLQNVQLEDVISERPENAEDFDVGATGMRVTVRGAQGIVLADGVFGKQAPDGTHIYFRYADQSAVYLARGLFRGELGGAELQQWRDRRLISMAEDQIVSFQIQYKTGSVLVQKSSDSWTVNQAPADPAKVKTWIGAAAHLTADDFADVASTDTPKAAALRDTLITVKSPAAQVALQVGTLDPKSKRYPVSVGADSGVAWISAPRMQSLLVKPADLKSK